MRRYLFVTLLGLLVASPALGQKRGGLQDFSGQVKGEQTEEELRAARRKAAGIQDLPDYGKAKEPPPKKIPWLGIILAVLALAACAPLGWKMYRSTRTDLEDQSTFGVGKGRGKEVAKGGEPAAGSLPSGRRPPARGKKEPPNVNETRLIDTSQVAPPSSDPTPRDAVWDAITTAQGNWVTADWVTSKSGIAAPVASDEIAALVSEGYLQEARDSRGKAVFRIAGDTGNKA